MGINKEVYYQEGRSTQFWQESDIARKSMKLYNIFSIIITILLIFSCCMILFSPFMTEEVTWVTSTILDGKKYYSTHTKHVAYSFIKMIFDKEFRLSVYGGEVDTLNFVILIAEAILVLVILILLIIALIKAFAVKKEEKEKDMYRNTFFEIKSPTSKVKTSRYDWAVIITIVALIYNGMASYVLGITTAVICIVVTAVVAIASIVLRFIRKKFANEIADEIIKFDFYKEEK